MTGRKYIEFIPAIQNLYPNLEHIACHDLISGATVKELSSSLQHLASADIPWSYSNLALPPFAHPENILSLRLQLHSEEPPEPSTTAGKATTPFSAFSSLTHLALLSLTVSPSWTNQIMTCTFPQLQVLYTNYVRSSLPSLYSFLLRHTRLEEVNISFWLQPELRLDSFASVMQGTPSFQGVITLAEVSYDHAASVKDVEEHLPPPGTPIVIVAASAVAYKRSWSPSAHTWTVTSLALDFHEFYLLSSIGISTATPHDIGQLSSSFKNLHELRLRGPVAHAPVTGTLYQFVVRPILYPSQRGLTNP